MSQLDTQVYILREQRDLPRDEQIRWYYHLPTFGDSLAAQRESKKEPDEEYRAQMFGVARIACCLERTQGVLRGRQPEDLDVSAPLAERIAWLLRLPASWVVELAAQVAEESDLDPEEE